MVVYPADKRTNGRMVTCLPKFLGWVDCQIFLGTGFRSRTLCARVELRYYNVLETYLPKVVVHLRKKSGCYGHLDWVCCLSGSQGVPQGQST